MFRRIVVGYDDSDEAGDALALGRLLAESVDAALVLAYVPVQQPRWYSNDRAYRRALRSEVSEVLDPAVASLPDGVRFEVTSAPSTSPTRGLHELAEAEHASLLVLGSTHRGPVGRVLLGSVGELLLMSAPCSVSVAPKGFSARAGGRLGVVAAAFDGSPEAGAALQSAHVLASAAGARLRVVSVAERGGPLNRSQRHRDDEPGHGGTDELHAALETALARLRGGDSAERVVESGDPVEVLARSCGEVDLLVVGSRGYGPMRHALLGSVSAKLMRSASCPLLVVPRGIGSPAGEIEAGAPAG